MEKKDINTYKNLIKELAEVVTSKDLSSLEFNYDIDKSNINIKIKRKKEVVEVNNLASLSSVTQPTSNIPSVTSKENDITTPSKEVDLKKHPGALISPMVGVAYTKPNPDAEDFVKIGTQVKEGDTVLLIEAMKVFNPVKAHKTGTVTQIFVRYAEPIEYGEVLLIIE